MNLSASSLPPFADQQCLICMMNFRIKTACREAPDYARISPGDTQLPGLDGSAAVLQPSGNLTDAAKLYQTFFKRNYDEPQIPQGCLKVKLT